MPFQLPPLPSEREPGEDKGEPKAPKRPYKPKKGIELPDAPYKPHQLSDPHRDISTAQAFQRKAITNLVDRHPEIVNNSTSEAVKNAAIETIYDFMLEKQWNHQHDHLILPNYAGDSCDFYMRFQSITYKNGKFTVKAKPIPVQWADKQGTPITPALQRQYPLLDFSKNPPEIRTGFEFNLRQLDIKTEAELPTPPEGAEKAKPSNTTNPAPKKDLKWLFDKFFGK